MKRFLILMLALLMVSAIFVACEEGGVDTPDVSDDGTNNDNETPDTDGSADGGDETAAIIICEDGETNYTVIYPDGSEDDVVSRSKQIALKITDLGGKMRTNNDWTRNIEATAANYEILIGNTNRPETLEVMNSIGYDDFAIRAVGNKIVVTAHVADRLYEAIDYFCANSVKGETVDGKAVVSYVADYQFKGTREYFINHENPLEGYRVVSSKDSASVANAKSFAEAIKKVYGVELEVVTDSTPAVEREIVIGDTNRDISKKYVNKESPFIYTVKAEGKTLFIGAAENSANNYIIKNIINKVIIDNYDNTFNYPAGYEESGTIGNFKDNAVLTEGADIRVFSFNVLFNNTLKDPTPEERSIALGAILAYFSPDVIGLQEMNEPWHKLFADLDSRYKIIDPTNGKGKTNNSCIAYNTEKTKLLEHGVQIFSQGDRAHLRLANWGYFEDIDSGKKYIVVNTHWDIVAEYVMTQATEMGNLVNELAAKYGCPVITTGDYNKKESSAEYKKFVEITGLRDSKYNSAVTGNVHATSHGYSPLGKMPSTSTKESIDHIFGSDKVEFLYFTVMTDQIVLDNSDHCPIYADIKLN